jgi:hypothetical protein
MELENVHFNSLAKAYLKKPIFIYFFLLEKHCIFLYKNSLCQRKNCLFPEKEDIFFKIAFIVVGELTFVV